MNRLVTCVLALIATAAPALAAEETIRETPAFDLTLGFGYARLEANNLAYNNGDRVEHTTWTSEVPVVALGATYDLPRQWRVSSNLKFGFGGNSFMSNYLWLTYAPSFDFDDWSDSSVHPASELDQYIDFDISLGRSFAVNDDLQLDLHGGFKYTRVGWTAFGGSAVFTQSDFRDSVANIPDETAYMGSEMEMPGFFVGAGGEWRHDNWTFSGLVRGGLIFDAKSTERWQFDSIAFVGSIDRMPFLSLAMRADYRIREHASIFVGGSYDRVFRGKGSLAFYDFGGLAAVEEDGSRADFSALTLQVGLKLDF